LEEIGADDGQCDGFFNKNIGNYPYKQYSFIQGGEWNMMSTLMLGNGTLEGIYGTATHELGHSWFQHVLASNESKHPWMDEGFTTYVSDLAENEFATKKSGKPLEGNYRAYYSLVNSSKATTHGDRYDENRPYSISSYVKGVSFVTIKLRDWEG
jgi:hypothetical protein